MATRTLYWNEATAGKWSEAAKWREGSPAGAENTLKTVPTAEDDVILGEKSNSLEIAAEAKCRSLNAEKYAKTLTIAASQKVKIGFSTGNAGMALKLGASMTLTNGASAVIEFISTVAEVVKVTTAGKTMPKMVFGTEATVGKYQLADKCTCEGMIQVNASGEFKTGNQEMVCAEFKESSVERGTTVAFGSSVVKITGKKGTVFETEGSKTTFKAETSTIEFTGTGTEAKKISVGGSSFTLNNVTIAAEAVEFITVPAIATLTLNTAGFANATKFKEATITTVTALVTNGKAASLVKMESTVAGKAWKLKVASGTVAVEYVSLKDSAAEGGATFQDINGKEETGNSGWTFETASEYTASVKGGKWSETAAWTGRKVPAAANDVILAATSGSIEVAAEAQCRSLDAANYAKTLTLAAKQEITIGTTTSNAGLCLKLGKAMTLTFTGSECRFLFVSSSKATEQITLAGKNVKGGLTFENTNGVWRFEDKVEANYLFVWSSEDLQLNGQEFILENFEVNGENTKTISMGSSKVNLNTANSHFELEGSGLYTFNAGTSTIEFTGPGEFEKILYCNRPTTFNVVTSTHGYLVFYVSCTIATLNLNTAGNTGATKVEEGRTVTITNAIKTNGKSGSLVKLESREPGKPWKLSKASGVVGLNWLSLQDSTAEGGAEWYAGNESTDVSGNSGWKFEMATFKEALTAKLEPAGKVTKAFSIAKKLTAALESVGKLPRNMLHGLAAKLESKGTFPRNIRRALTATIESKGSLTKGFAIAKKLTASLESKAALQRNVLHRAQAILESAGSMVPKPGTVIHAIAASLSFAGALPRNTVHGLKATLESKGALPRNTLHALSAKLEAAGQLPKSVVHGLKATLFNTGINGPTTLLDSFNRANEEPLSGAWSLIAGGVITGAVIGKAYGEPVLHVDQAYWNATQYREPVVSAEVTALPGESAKYPILWACLQNPTVEAQKNGYRLRLLEQAEAGKFEWKVDRFDLGVATQVMAKSSVATAIGDRIALSVSNGKVAMNHKVGAGAWTVVKEEADSKYAKGYVGIGTFGTGTRLTNFEVGFNALVNLERNVLHGLLGALSFVGAVVPSPIKNFAAVLAFQGTLPRSVSRGLKATMTFAGKLPRTVTRTLAASLAPEAKLGRSIALKLEGALDTAGALPRSILHGLQASLESAGSHDWNFVVHLKAALSFAGTLPRNVSVVLKATLMPIGRTRRNVTKALRGSISFIGSVAGKRPPIKRIGRGGVAILGSIVRMASNGSVRRSTPEEDTPGVRSAGSIRRTGQPDRPNKLNED
jgi:hypothetical protein